MFIQTLKSEDVAGAESRRSSVKPTIPAQATTDSTADDNAGVSEAMDDTYASDDELTESISELPSIASKAPKEPKSNRRSSEVRFIYFLFSSLYPLLLVYPFTA
jgi:hypothetical protein